MASETARYLWNLLSAIEFTNAIEDAMQIEIGNLTPDLRAAANRGDAMQSAKISERMNAFGDVLSILRREAEQYRPTDI